MKNFFEAWKICNAWFFRVNTQKIAFWWVTVSNDWEVTSILVGLLLLTHNKKIVTCQLAPSNQKTKAHYQILDIFQINIWETKFPKRLLYSIPALYNRKFYWHFLFLEKDFSFCPKKCWKVINEQMFRSSSGTPCSDRRLQPEMTPAHREFRSKWCSWVKSSCKEKGKK